MIKKKLPIGISDFKKIIEGGYYYIDKTDFIKEILEKKVEATLITRPRRFGKTLSMTTLKYFLDIKDAENNKHLFDGLNISRTEFMNEQGRYPVIYLTLKDCDKKTYLEFLKEFKYLREHLDDWDKEEFDRILYKKDDGEYGSALQFLSEKLYEYYKIKPVILIDEYDAPIISANERGRDTEIL